MKKMGKTGKEIDVITDRMFTNARELNQLGFDVTVGTNHYYNKIEDPVHVEEMLEMKVRKRVEEKPKLKILKFFGLKMR